MSPSPDRPPWLTTLLGGPLGFRSVLGMSPVPLPGSPEENRAFYQGRLRLALLIAGCIWSVVIIAVPIVIGADNQAELQRFLRAPGFVVHLTTTVSLLALVVYLYRARPSLSALQWIDFVATSLQSISVAAALIHTQVKWRPELAVLIAIGALHALRAATVPTTAVRSAILALLGWIPLLIGTYYVYETQPEGGYPGGLTMTLMAGIWCLVITMVVTSISWVIYGLQLRVKEATELGQYELEQKIGEGGMGVVYRARHALLRRPTAVKLLPPDRAGRGAIARFEREVRLTARLSHPNIVAVYDYGHTPDGVFYYAMEFLDGVDLEKLVSADGPQPAGRVLKILLHVASALAEAHHVGLIHRDVKPANVFLCRRGLDYDAVKVLDFGLVRDVSDKNVSQSAVTLLAGTPLYMAPEQILDPRSVDGRSDLYALGAVAYFLLTGTPPFVGESVVEVCGHHLHSTVEPPSERLGRALPADLERIVLSLLEKQPGQRPGSARALAAELRACADLDGWAEADAERWWRERGPIAQSLAESEPVSSAVRPSARTLAVDLAQRAASRRAT